MKFVYFIAVLTSWIQNLGTKLQIFDILVNNDLEAKWNIENKYSIDPYLAP